ncbi:MAG: hypothetical protein JW773_04965, partial [Desulfuromonadales bacterium]|nr:hypothetical protein [Desulfuromonadales bacterium]
MKNITVMLAIIMLSGCVPLRPTDPYAAVDAGRFSPSVFDVKHGAPEIPAGPLTLQLAIKTALANNPEVAARGWDASAAQARRDQAFG